MILCIAEKPSVARDLAKQLKAFSMKEGYIEGNGYAVTWTFGHLCMLKDPEDYHSWWKQWDNRMLPIIPKRFGIKPIPQKSYERQLDIITELVAKAEYVINCGDAGQEGELIQQWVLQLAKCKVPIKRLWVSSLTEEALAEGFQNLRTNEEMQPLYHAGLARAIGDWILGINATRLYTTRYRSYAASRQPLSVGRVQTPTLALIVDRQKEIENFVPQTTYEIRTLYRQVVFRQIDEAFPTEAEAQNKLQLLEEKPFEVTKLEVKQGREYPQRLFDLTALQVEANKRFKFSAGDTLNTIQSLYEKKLTTYPRVDTNYLPEDLWPKIPSILQNLQKIAEYTLFVEPLLSKGKLSKTKRIFDNKKITDHHAIIPTGVVPTSTLSPQEQKIYDLVVRRFLAAFYPEAKISTTSVEGQVDSFGFKATGKQVLSEGWRVVYQPNEEEDTDEPATPKEGKESSKVEEKEQIMPNFTKGEQGPHLPEVKKKTSQPPKYYTEATLLRTMETAGKLVEDEALRDGLKQNGIGRPSTRAAIIETLLKRGYTQKQGNSLRATERGIALIDLIKDPTLKSVELTGAWECKLRAIERGEYSPSLFLNELKQQIHLIVNEEMQSPYSPKYTPQQPSPSQKK